MRLIAHRGNVFGPNLDRENSPDYILEALDYGCDVELDLWVNDNNLFLGHSAPNYPIDPSFIEINKEKFWVHCKNIEALWTCMFKLNDINYFWHQNDLATITSNGFLWVYPGNQPMNNSISVLPELYGEEVTGCIGICSDYISHYVK